MVPIDWMCEDCDVEMEASEDYGDSIVFECPECGMMVEFYEDEDGGTYANDIY